MHRCTATRRARVARRPTVHCMFPKPSALEKNLHVVIRSSPALYRCPRTGRVGVNEYGATSSLNHVRRISSSGTRSFTTARQSFSMMSHKSLYTGVFRHVSSLPTAVLAQPASLPPPAPSFTPEPCPIYVSFSLPAVIDEMSIAYSAPESSSETSLSSSVDAAARIVWRRETALRATGGGRCKKARHGTASQSKRKAMLFCLIVDALVKRKIFASEVKRRRILFEMARRAFSLRRSPAWASRPACEALLSAPRAGLAARRRGWHSKPCGAPVSWKTAPQARARK